MTRDSGGLARYWSDETSGRSHSSDRLLLLREGQVWGFETEPIPG